MSETSGLLANLFTALKEYYLREHSWICLGTMTLF